MIIAVSGWRGFTSPQDAGWIALQLGLWAGTLSHRVLPYWRVGDEPAGVDSIALRTFQECGMEYCQYFANWNLPNKAGGPVRSSNMLKGTSQHDLFQGRLADYLLAFPQPGKRLPKHEEVSGTWRAIELAKQYGISTIMPGYVKPELEGLF